LVMNVMVHRLSMILALFGFCVGAGVSLASGVTVLTTVLRGTVAFVVVGVLSRVLFGSACGAIARDLAEEDAEPRPEAETKE